MQQRSATARDQTHILVNVGVVSLACKRPQKCAGLITLKFTLGGKMVTNKFSLDFSENKIFSRLKDRLYFKI